jgi:hypothetical protein
MPRMTSHASKGDEQVPSGAERKWFLEDRRHERVVDDGQQAVFAGDGA